MAYEVVIPRLGLTMEEGRVVEWYRQDGETVEAGELLFAVETDKAIQDVEAPADGVVYHVSGLPTDPLPIGTVIGYIAAPGEEVPLRKAGSADEPVDISDPATGLPATAAAQPTILDAKRRLSSPAARRRAKELGVDWRAIERPGGGPILVFHVEQAVEKKQPSAESRPEEVPIKASPVARRLAIEAGIDLATLAMEKPGGRIHREDVEVAISARDAVEAQPPSAPRKAETIPVTEFRRVIARRMSEGVHTAAPVTLTTEADATELAALREQLKTALSPRADIVPTYNDLFVKLTSVALREHPMLNAHWKSGGVAGQGDEIVVPDSIDIAVAVDTKAGLLAPIIRDTITKSIQEIAYEFRILVEKGQSGRLGPDELQGGTFTITNLGMYNVDAFTPIINLPQCAILGVGRIVDKAVVWDQQLVARKRVTLSLTFDHRVVDGGPAARFLDTIREYVEQPYLWLTR